MKPKSVLISSLGTTLQSGPPPAWEREHQQAEQATIFRPRPPQKESSDASSPR